MTEQTRRTPENLPRVGSRWMVKKGRYAGGLVRVDEVAEDDLGRWRVYYTVERSGARSWGGLTWFLAGRVEWRGTLTAQSTA